MVQAVYENTPPSELEELATRHLEKSQLDKTLQNLVQWIPQCTHESLIESMHLMDTRCSKLKEEIEYVLSCHEMASNYLLAVRSLDPRFWLRYSRRDRKR